MTASANPHERGGERTWTVLDLLKWTTDHFAAKGLESPRLDAELLLAHALGLRRLDLYLRYEDVVGAGERARYRELIGLRAGKRIPVALLLGEKEFWSLKFKVSGEVLTPRPDTETLVEAALSCLPDAERPYRVLDVGTGSGAVALSLAHEKPLSEFTATDISPAALEIARANAEALGKANSVRFLEGNLFEPVEGERFDLIVANPPYLALAEADTLAPELEHEPRQALFGGDDGYSVLRPLVEQAPGLLAPGGWLILEVDPRQAETVASWLRAAGLGKAQLRMDLAGRARVVMARWPGSGKRAGVRDPAP
ncbi:MAG: peptide chain release factor N(5)-glutamine methyltransferase [Myxococcota bacterium]|nr:peptide chain release factor N(5)-glutamine methyltransferase [Myxococcota bacterium]